MNLNENLHQCYNFVIDLLLSSAMNMAIKILYFGRMEGGDWYYAVF